MKTLYALALICLSVPAFAGELDVKGPQTQPAQPGYVNELADDFDFGDDFRAMITASITPKSEAATPKSEEIWAEIWSAPESETAYRQFKAPRAVFDDDVDFGDDFTALITKPVTPKSELATSNSEEVWAEIWSGPGSERAYRQVTAPRVESYDDAL